MGHTRRTCTFLGRAPAILGAFIGAIVIAAITSERASGQAPGPRAGAPEVAAAPVSQFVPRQDLLAYLEFDGLDAHAAAWRESAAYKLLNNTKLGALLEDLALQSIELAQESVAPEHRRKGDEVVGVFKQIMRDGFVVAVSGKADAARPILVLRRGDRPEFIRLLGALGGLVAPGQADDAFAASRAGRTLHRLGASGIWWVENGSLVVTVKEKVDEILAVLDGKAASASDHPLRLQLSRAERDFAAVAVGFFDVAALAPLPPSLIGLGLDGLERIDFCCGFDEGALASVFRVVAPAPRRGALALLDQPAFGIDSLPPLPASTTAFAVVSIDLAKSYDQIDALLKRLGADSSAGLGNPTQLSLQRLDLRKDILAYIGPQLAFYAQAPAREEDSSAAGLLTSRLAGFSAQAQVRDEARMTRAVGLVLNTVNPAVNPARRVTNRNRLAQVARSLTFRKVERPTVTYVMDWPPNLIAPPFSTMLQPTVMLSHDQLVVAGSTAAAERRLAAGPRWQPAGAFIPVVRRLPPEMIYLSLGDPRVATPILTAMLPVLVRQINAELAIAQQRAGKVAGDVFLRLDPAMIPQVEELNRLLFPSATTVVVDGQGAVLTHREAIPTVTSPAVAGALLALLMPKVQSAYETSRRAQCVNNLKQIALAMHNYHAANNAFPRAAKCDEKGKPLLSWRVAILPYLGQQELYDRFKLDEPWDSPHNKALLKEMPATYLCKTRTKVEPFTTNYQVFVGRGALFEKDQDIPIANVTDGTSNTLLVVEARDAIPWTKPADLTFDPEAALSLCGAGSPHPEGFNASTADGAVRFIKSVVDLNLFRALITRNAGEVVVPGSF